jgi:hypothetical protein
MSVSGGGPYADLSIATFRGMRITPLDEDGQPSGPSVAFPGAGRVTLGGLVLQEGDQADATHDPCCSSHGVTMGCDQYRRTHFVEVGRCCEHDDRPARDVMPPGSRTQTNR